FFQAEDGIRDFHVTGVQTCALPIFLAIRDGATFPAAAGSIVLCTGGRVVVSSADAEVALAPGEAVYVTADDAGTVVTVDAAGERSEERRVGQSGGCGAGGVHRQAVA